MVIIKYYLQISSHLYHLKYYLQVKVLPSSSCGIFVSYNLIPIIVIEMDKSQDCKIATKDKQIYIDSINNGTGNISIEHELIESNILNDIQQKCFCCGLISDKGVKLMCSTECQRSDWKNIN